MGRFDALTQIDEKPITQTPSLVVVPPANNQSQQKPTTPRPKNKIMSTKPQNRLPTNPSPTLNHFEKLEKYTTHLEPSMVKKIKVYAAEKEIKDYEVIKEALREYFTKNK